MSNPYLQEGSEFHLAEHERALSEPTEAELLEIADAIIEKQILDAQEERESLCTYCGFHYPCKCTAAEIRGV